MLIHPIAALAETVDNSWIDLNGHMGSSSYFLAFQRGLAAMFRPLGFGSGYREQGFSIFQRDIRISYEHELRLGDRLTIRSWLLAHDNRSLLHMHEMRNGNDVVAARAEYLTVNVSLKTRRSAAFPPTVKASLDALAADFAALPCKPDQLPLVRSRLHSVNENG